MGGSAEGAGVVKRPNATEPRQGELRGARALVVFGYDLTNQYEGEIVRDDAEEPGLVIIRLDSGRYVLSTECQYRPLSKEPAS